MNWMDTWVIPIITGALSPIVLFLFGSLLMRSNFITKKIAKTYQTVKTGLELNLDEDIASADEIDQTDDVHLNDDTPTNKVATLTKVSKDYGADDANGWKVRTYYVISTKQLAEHKYINFKIKNLDDITIKLATAELIKRFDVKAVADIASKIRIYIYQAEADEDTHEFYMVRFGKKAMTTPIHLEKTSTDLYRLEVN
ncbi:hypothetical protein KAR50_07425 [Periweissella fabaria]|uniref:Uncharacterized protein n=1 Tax=Periweissella fabaria TaxID=546157 RepID=A0ABM8Z677_9LACO|nr:hypothetical protein [Periweissella fabaria]MCM0597672.1 hypothetical protein [Periweissella fabaria]CAH0416857.1 hypothetical protein WFA24289_01170 [Periweissella fabaria]